MWDILTAFKAIITNVTISNMTHLTRIVKGEWDTDVSMMCILLNYAPKGNDVNDMDKMTLIHHNVSKLKMAFQEGFLFSQVDAHGKPLQLLIENEKKVIFVQYQQQFFSLKYIKMQLEQSFQCLTQCVACTASWMSFH